MGPLHDLGRINLQWERFAAATVAYTLLEPRLHRASDNHVVSSRVSVARLHAAGRRRIGLAMAARLDHRVADFWTAGYLLETFEEGLADPEMLHRPAAEFIRWVRRAKPDAIVCTDKRIPAGSKLLDSKCPRISLTLASTYPTTPATSRASIRMPVPWEPPPLIWSPANSCATNGASRKRPKPRSSMVDGATMPPERVTPELIEKSERLLSQTGSTRSARPVTYD